MEHAASTDRTTHSLDLAELPSAVLADSLGGVSGSTYDTAYLVIQAAQQPSRFPPGIVLDAVNVLLKSSNQDGSWGARRWPEQFRLVPSLAAVAALAEIPMSAARGSPFADRFAPVVRAGLEFLARDLQRFAGTAQPDLMAVEFTVPALLERLESSLTDADAPGRASHALLPAEFRHWVTLKLRQALSVCAPEHRQLQALRAAARGGSRMPVHIGHSLELLGDLGPRLDDLATPLPVGCSAAATAAFITWSGIPRRDAIELLTRQAARLGGALPVIMQMTTFELLWVLSSAIRSRIPFSADTRRRWRSLLHHVLEPAGVRGGPGLPPDGDDTATTLYLLQRLGAADVDPRPQFAFIADGWGCASYPGERTMSTTTTAHALEALGLWQTRNSATPSALVTQTASRLVSYLLAAQHPDGYWTDKWHASPLYATSCVLIALTDHGGTAAAPAVRRATDWILQSQREDGAWGIWTSTLEETAFALTALRDSPVPSPRIQEAMTRGCAFLAASETAGPEDPVRTPLWQGKELYEPHRIVQAAILSVRNEGSSHHAGDVRPNHVSR
jgi:halimadienyl-diphosphate synthase